jgi:hypothetical protein
MHTAPIRYAAVSYLYTIRRGRAGGGRVCLAGGGGGAPLGRAYASYCSYMAAGLPPAPHPGTHPIYRNAAPHSAPAPGGPAQAQMTSWPAVQQGCRRTIEPRRGTTGQNAIIVVGGCSAGTCCC